MKTFILILLCFLTVNAQEKETTKKPLPPKKGEAFGFSVENDARVLGGPGSDQAYSNGFKVSYSYTEDHVPSWARSTVSEIDYFKSKINKTKVNFGISLAQQLYTPANVGTAAFIPDDRRYAAWTYMGFSSQIKTEFRADLFEVDLGMVGPSALGEQVQNNFHRLIKTATAEGWTHQLSDEPTLQLSYQRKLKFYEMDNASGKYLDVIPFYGGGFGNVHMGLHVGALVRFGLHIPDDFGPSRLSASDGESFISEKTTNDHLIQNFYVFAGARGNAIAHDIFLDGNTVRPNRTVHKYPFTAETELGFGSQVGPHWNLVWRFVTRTPEFEERQNYNSFASINIMYLM